MMLGVPSPDPTVEPVLPLADVPHGVCRAPVCGEPLDDAPLCGPAAGLVDWPGVGAGVGPVPVVPVLGGMLVD
jgi:hypothetical protein